MARAHLTSALGPALAAAVPAWLGVTLVGSVVLGGNACRRASSPARLQPAVAAILAVTWLLLIGPAVVALVRAPGLAYLRSLPAPRGSSTAIALAGAVALQLPWTILWLAGEGALAAVVATVAIAAIGLGVAAMPRPRRARVARYRSAVAAMAGMHLRALRHRRRRRRAALGLGALAGLPGGALVVGEAPPAMVAGLAAVLVALALAGPLGAIAGSDSALAPIAWTTPVSAPARSPPPRWSRSASASRCRRRWRRRRWRCRAPSSPGSVPASCSGRSWRRRPARSCSAWPGRRR
ncbi:MAG: hypothetical protein R2939_03475 [Kofleriaceae bacterium]